MAPVSQKAKEQCRILAQYILSLHADRYLTFGYFSPPGQDQYLIPEKMSPDQRRHALPDVTAMLLEGVRRGSGLILRIANQVHGKDVLNGFRMDRRGICRLSAEKVRWAQETMPDGSRRPDPTAVYQVAFVDLPMLPGRP